MTCSTKRSVPTQSPAADQTGPLPGEGSNAVAGSGPSNSNATGGSPTSHHLAHLAHLVVHAAELSPSPTTNRPGPNSGVGGLSQLLEPLLGGLS